ncbi:hypothetical protein WJX79_008587 [Trebouxia sp. C0005]
MHSYGGCPGAAAAQGLSAKDRAADGKTGGIIGLIFIAAFLLHQGDCVFNGVGGKWEPWHCVDEKTGLIRPLNSQIIMLGRCCIFRLPCIHSLLPRHMPADICPRYNGGGIWGGLDQEDL